jgi:hypothetical protein
MPNKLCSVPYGILLFFHTITGFLPEYRSRRIRLFSTVGKPAGHYDENNPVTELLCDCNLVSADSICANLL